MAKRIYAVKEVKKLMQRAAEVSAPTAMGGGALLTTTSHALDGPEHVHKDAIGDPWTLVDGGIIGPTPGDPPTGEVVIQVKTTSGAPTHAASRGTPCWNAVDEILYVNSDGATTWVAVSDVPPDALIDLADVDLTGLADTNILRWDAGVSLWTPVAAPTGMTLGSTPSTQAFGDSAAGGASSDAAKNDHKHGMPALGTTAGTAAAGNDARLSDARTPAAHEASHLLAGGDALSGLSPSQVTGTAVVTGDSRLSDARTPTTHHTSHEVGGGDAVAITHAQTTGKTANDHHNQSHDHSASGDGTALVPATFTIPGGGKLGAGTSFPASPADGDLYYRTDAGEWFQYHSSGTQWRCTVEHEASMVVVDTLQPFTTGGQLYLSAPFAPAGALYITVVVCNTQCGPTNDGTKYWTPTLYRWDTSQHSLGSFNTSADTASAWSYHPITVNTAVDATHKFFYLDCVKTSTPSGLYVLATVGYRHTLT